MRVGAGATIVGDFSSAVVGRVDSSASGALRCAFGPPLEKATERGPGNPVGLLAIVGARLQLAMMILQLLKL